MKKYFLILVLCTFCKGLLSQNRPDCNTLLVKNIMMDVATPTLMNVTLKNNCAACTTGINGCVYMELRVIRTIAPFDTIAASKCYCWYYPANNGGQLTYPIAAAVTVLPPLSQLRVSATCGCDTIPFSADLFTGYKENNAVENMKLQQLSGHAYLILNAPADLFISVKNLAGIMLTGTGAELPGATIDLSDYPAGVYLMEVKDKRKGNMKIFKMIRY